MKTNIYSKLLALLIGSFAFTSTSLSQGGRVNPGDTFGTYTFQQKFTSSGGTVFQLSYGCDAIGDAIDGIESQYDSCDVKVDTIANGNRFPITKFQNGYSIPSLGNAGANANANGGQDSIDYINLVNTIVDSGQVYMKEIQRDTCDNGDVKKLVYNIRCYKPDDSAHVSAKWMADRFVFLIKKGPHPGPQPASLGTDSMTVSNYLITITCTCPEDSTETDTSVVDMDEGLDGEEGFKGSIGEYEETLSEMTVYPNPAHSKIYFAYPISDNAESDEEIDVILNVYNAYGQMVEQINVSGNTYGNNGVQLNLSDYSAGVYYYSLSVGQQIYRGQFMKTAQ